MARPRQASSCRRSSRTSSSSAICGEWRIASFPSRALLHGIESANIAIRKRALARGLSLNGYALSGNGSEVACRTEADLFEALGLAEIPAELREDAGEIEAAEKGTLPNLVTVQDLTGTFHCHSDWSDGEATLEQMAEGARSAGLAYLGIADHSRSLRMAGGLTIERVRDQWARIDALNEKFGHGFRLFKGTECDILADGTLDYPDEVLEGFDYVVASVHSHFRMSREEMTARIIRAVSNPRVTMLGHPTGRLLLARDSYAVDLDAVIDAAARAGTMIEINANPHRLDLDAVHCRRARQKGVRIVINPDAHSVSGLQDLTYGVSVARRAWLSPADLLNTAPLEKVARQLEQMRPGEGQPGQGRTDEHARIRPCEAARSSPRPVNRQVHAQPGWRTIARACWVQGRPYNNY